MDSKCGLGGIIPGSPWPGTQDPSTYVSGSPKVFKATDGSKVWRLKENRADFQQFVYIKNGKVSAVSREYDGEQETKVMEALKARYGQPANPGSATGSLGAVTGKVQSRTLWLNGTCGTRIEFLRQETGMFKGKFNHSVMIAVVVSAADKKAPGDSPNPLD
jgi:hypothetical protein